MHNHGFELLIEVVGWFIGRIDNGAAYDKVWMEGVFHRVDGEVVIDAAVEERNTVFANWFEHEGEGHGGANGITKVAVSEDNRLLAINV